MAHDDSQVNLATDMSLALSLLRASHEMYQDLLSVVRANVAEDGSADFDGLTKGVNRALTGFAPRDLEIRRLLADFAGSR